MSQQWVIKERYSKMETTTTNRPAPRRQFLCMLGAGIAAPALVMLGGCSESTDQYKADIPALSLSSSHTLTEIERLTQGFVVGNMISRQTVYVFFDPQCPHCARLWLTMPSVSSFARFRWTPVSLMGNLSLLQSVAFLESDDPVALMNEHEKMILAGSRGITGQSEPSAQLRAAVEQNTEVLKKLGATGVPYMIGTNQTTGQLVGQTGAGGQAYIQQMFGWR